MHRAEFEDFAALGGARSRRVHHGRRNLDAAQSNRSALHAYFLQRAARGGQAMALFADTAPANFENVADTSILIAGAGAIGSIVGGMLHAAGRDVTLLGRRTHLEAIARDGLRISGLLGARTVP